MFTWEEAGQLRQMIQIVVWAVVLLILGSVIFIEREPIAHAVRAGAARVEHALHLPRHRG